MLVIVHILNVSLSVTSLPVRLGRKGGWLKKVENHGLDDILPPGVTLPAPSPSCQVCLWSGECES